jgi:hypothetical protein
MPATFTRARILLKSADGWSTAALAAALCEATVTNVPQRFAQGGLAAVLHDKYICSGAVPSRVCRRPF